MDPRRYRPRRRPPQGGERTGPGRPRGDRAALRAPDALRPAVPRGVHPQGPDDLRRPAGARARPPARPPAHPRRAEGPVPGDPGGRAPGHRPAPVRDPAVAVRGTLPARGHLARHPPGRRQALRGGRPQAVHLRVSRRRHRSLPEGHRRSDRGPGRGPLPADGQLPQRRPHPGRGERRLRAPDPGTARPSTRVHRARARPRRRGRRGFRPRPAWRSAGGAEPERAVGRSRHTAGAATPDNEHRAAAQRRRGAPAGGGIPGPLARRRDPGKHPLP